VTDATGNPVADVAVALRLPDEGPTGLFADGSRSAVGYTDATGIVKFAPVAWGAAAGSIAIRVTAVKGDMRAAALIEQTILAPPGTVAQTPTPSNKAAAAPATSQVTPIPTPIATATASSTNQSPSAQTVPPMPGTPTSVHSGATPEKTAANGTQSPVSTAPDVSVVNTAASKGGGNNTKKWVVIGAVALGAGVGVALALAGKGGAAPVASSSSTAVGIGTPTISVGH
jgi:hypothetical protein